MAGISPLLCMLSSKLVGLLQLPRAWEGLRSSVQGQQLLQAALSVLLVHKEGSPGKASSFHIPLMQLVSADIRAFLAGSEEGSCPAGSSKQQLQLLLPHPQLVVCVLDFAALRYKRLHKQLLRLSTERVARPDGVSNMDEVIHFLIGHAEPLVAPAALSAIGAAAAAVGAGEAAMVGAEAAAAAAEGVGTATAAATTAGAGGGRAGDGGEGLASAGAAAGARTSCCRLSAT
jgi:hypothetical protein